MDNKKLGKGVKFERIRRITGYLVGTLDKWNDAKKAEEKDRVKHSGVMKMANEKRLIDANELKRKLVELGGEPDYQHPDEDWGVGVCMAEGIVDEMPTVDAVEVVRCKDCIHYDFGVCLKIYSDGAVSQYAWQARNDDDFCSYGERKDTG